MKCIKNLKRKFIIWKFDRLMYNLTFGGVRKDGVTDATTYKLALKYRRNVNGKTAQRRI